MRPSRDTKYQHALDALRNLNDIAKEGNDKQVAFWCGAASRRVAEFVRDCLAEAAKKTQHKVINP